jgi:hypothetical protein
LGRVVSTTAAAVAGSSSPSTAAAVQGLVVAMSGGVVVSLRCSTCRGRVQGVLEVVARHVASARPCAHGRDASGMPGEFGRAISGELRRLPRRWPVLGGVGGCGGECGRQGQGWRARMRGGEEHGRHGPAWPCLACSLSLPRVSMLGLVREGTREHCRIALVKFG